MKPLTVMLEEHGENGKNYRECFLNEKRSDLVSSVMGCVDPEADTVVVSEYVFDCAY